MATDKRFFSIDDLKAIRDKYNETGTAQHELYKGLDCIIDNLEQSMLDCQRLSEGNKMDDEKLEKLAKSMERAYSTEKNRENAVALVLYSHPDAELYLLHAMWEAIDRFVDMADVNGAFKG